MFLKGDFGDLVIIRSNEHSFLGMNITMRDDSKVQVEMKDQLEELFEMFGGESYQRKHQFRQPNIYGMWKNIKTNLMIEGETFLIHWRQISSL